ncbi:NERD domain-containing protein [Cerasibacillus terrae]|uniref:NERD domain-containing protein n=1 Tax=Cerasibacillus terrae TaxID=2498845 RepID=A0A5C8NST3_9BACI|nr:nuclease-related domain-containing protein [Cerasibacillus terrae]TXL64070.1 NERD domain-containing protein [Cerasibacillus terrae]
MFYKPRTKPKELITLELLNNRMIFSRKALLYYRSLKKGYEGEVLFDQLTEKLQCPCFILNDLLLEVNHTTFQIDSLIIIQGQIYFYEVKNYEGDYYYETDQLYKKTKIEIMNPLNQLSRSETLLRKLLLNHGIKLQINPFVVFINPTFTLYQAPLNKPIIFPTQVNQYMKNLNTIPSKLTNKHRKLADLLLSLHKNDPPISQVPSYEYNQLRKGITCLKCVSFSMYVEKRKCVCRHCGFQESVTNAVLRNVKEFKVLFPNKKITTNLIHDWCQIVPSKKVVRRILSNHFHTNWNHRWTYYE